MRSDPRQLASLAQDGKGSSGRIVPRPAARSSVPHRTDLARPSQALPAIFTPTSVSAALRPSNTAAFTPSADTHEASRAMLDGAVALAQTAVDAATDPDLNAYLMKRVAARS